MEAFLYALFAQLNEVIAEDYNKNSRSRPLASWLREYMTEGQTFNSQGPKRVAFYDAVVKRAKAHFSHIEICTVLVT